MEESHSSSPRQDWTSASVVREPVAVTVHLQEGDGVREAVEKNAGWREPHGYEVINDQTSQKKDDGSMKPPDISRAFCNELYNHIINRDASTLERFRLCLSISRRFDCDITLAGSA